MNIVNLNKNSLYHIALNLNLRDLFNLNETNKRFNKIYSSNNFWALKVRGDYPSKFNNKDDEITYKDYYLLLSYKLYMFIDDGEESFTKKIAKGIVKIKCYFKKIHSEWDKLCFYIDYKNNLWLMDDQNYDNKTIKIHDNIKDVVQLRDENTFFILGINGDLFYYNYKNNHSLLFDSNVSNISVNQYVKYNGDLHNISNTKKVIDPNINIFGEDYYIKNNGDLYFNGLFIQSNIKDAKLAYYDPVCILFFLDNLGNLYTIKNTKIDILQSNIQKFFIYATPLHISGVIKIGIIDDDNQVHLSHYYKGKLNDLKLNKNILAKKIIFGDYFTFIIDLNDKSWICYGVYDKTVVEFRENTIDIIQYNTNTFIYISN